MVALERGWRDGGDVVGGILVLAFPGSLSMLLLFCWGLRILLCKKYGAQSLVAREGMLLELWYTLLLSEYNREYVGRRVLLMVTHLHTIPPVSAGGPGGADQKIRYDTYVPIRLL